MKTGSEELKEQKKIFLETADIIDEKEVEALMGRYLFKIVELAAVLSNA